MAQNTFDAEMVYIEPYEHPDWGWVGGFEVDKYECCHPSATSYEPGYPNGRGYHGTAPGTTLAACSRQGVPAWTGLTLGQAMQACANRNGDTYSGFHLMTAYEWAIVAEWSRLKNTLPHGNNNDSATPGNVTYTEERGILNRYAYGINSAYRLALTGTGPTTWSHNHGESGIYDLAGNCWCFLQGLMLQQTTGYAWILGTLETSADRAPYGTATAVGAGSLTDSRKDWTTNEFAGMSLVDTNQAFYTINSNTGTTLTLAAGTPASGPYVILRSVSTDLTNGAANGAYRVLTLRSDADLGPFALPATWDGTGSATYQNAVWSYNRTLYTLCTAMRGGAFNTGVGTSVYALRMDYPTSATGYNFGFRCARSL